MDSEVVFCMFLSLVCLTRFHQDLGWLSCLRSPTFRHMYNRGPCFTGHYGQCCFVFLDTLCHRCFLLLDPMAFLRRSSFLRAPLMTRIRNGSLVSDALVRGFLCFRICLINSFIVLANDCECFCCFSRTWNCPFRVVVAD